MDEIHLYARNHKNKKLARIVRETATNDFMSLFYDGFYDLLPRLPDGFAYSPGSGVVLKMSHVEPHRDDRMGCTMPGFKHWGGAFGLTQGFLKLHVCNSSKAIHEGQFVMFKDNKMHSVYAQRQWKGVAVQVLKKR